MDKTAITYYLKMELIENDIDPTPLTIAFYEDILKLEYWVDDRMWGAAYRDLEGVDPKLIATRVVFSFRSWYFPGLWDRRLERIIALEAEMDMLNAT